MGLMWAFGGFIAKSFSLKMRKIAKCHSFYPIYILICGRNMVSCQFAYQSVSIQLPLLCSWVMVRRNYIFSILQQRCNKYLNYASFCIKKLTYRLDFIFWHTNPTYKLVERLFSEGGTLPFRYHECIYSLIHVSASTMVSNNMRKLYNKSA